MNKGISVIGPGRWGTFIAWYLNYIGFEVSLYGKAGAKQFEELRTTRKNAYLTLPEDLKVISDLEEALKADIIAISVGAQHFSALTEELAAAGARGKKFVLCMKGIEISTGRRLSEIARENLDPTNRIAVWLGPGHVQEFIKEVPNCMVIDSEDEDLKVELVDAFSSPLIRFYYGTDLIGNEIGAAAKNVVGIAAGMLDGAGLQTLKGALMSRGTREVARLIEAMGGQAISAYGLCHLGDYEATVFSQHSHNRRYGEAFIRGEAFEGLAEGYYTTKAMMKLAQLYGVELPITQVLYGILYENKDPHSSVDMLMNRSLKSEF